MNILRTTCLLLSLCSPWLAQANSETQQYCNEMYPADSYEAQERQFYIQECMEAYGESNVSESAVEDTSDEVPYFDGTVEDFVEEIPAPEPAEDGYYQ